MKRILFGAALFFCAVFLCIAANRFTAKKSGEMLRKIESLETKIAAGTGKASGSDGEALLLDWKEAHAVFCLYLSHDRLCALDVTLSALPVYLREGEKAEALALCREAKEAIRALKDAESLSFGNVF